MERKGVYWHEEHERYQAQISRDGRCIYLGEFTEADKDLAEALVEEAKTTPTELLSDLKRKYRTLRADRRCQSPDGPISDTRNQRHIRMNGNGHRPVPEPEPVEAPSPFGEIPETVFQAAVLDDPDADVIAKLRAALAAQRDLMAATADYRAKQAAAAQAWEAYEETLDAICVWEVEV